MVHRDATDGAGFPLVFSAVGVINAHSLHDAPAVISDSTKRMAPQRMAPQMMEMMAPQMMDAWRPQMMRRTEPSFEAPYVSGGTRLPHGGLRPLHRKSTCLTRLTLGPCVVQIWLRNTRNLTQRNPRSPPCGGGDSFEVPALHWTLPTRD